MTVRLARFETLHLLLPQAPSGPRPGLVVLVGIWRDRQRTRRQLSALDDRQLADVGLSREQQRSECAQPFWRP